MAEGRGQGEAKGGGSRRGGDGSGGDASNPRACLIRDEAVAQEENVVDRFGRSIREGILSPRRLLVAPFADSGAPGPLPPPPPSSSFLSSLRMAFWHSLSSKPELDGIKRFFRNVAGDGDVNYDQFESRMDGTDIVTFRENDKEFRLFGTGLHVKWGATAAALIGLIITLVYCVFYTFYHSRGLGRNPFIDHIELIDLVFAFVVGLPCHVLLLWGIFKERKMLFTPFLIFYCTNFLLNIIFTVLTVVAAAFDVHRSLFGNVKYDFSWTIFQVVFTSAQGLAIYVVIKCRKYVAAKEHWRIRSAERNLASPSSVVADGAYETMN